MKPLLTCGVFLFLVVVWLPIGSQTAQAQLAPCNPNKEICL